MSRSERHQPKKEIAESKAHRKRKIILNEIVKYEATHKNGIATV